MSDKGQTIYFVKPVGLPGPVKIGCTKFVKERVVALAAWSPFELEVLVTILGDFKLEQNIHDCLYASHLRSEWFEPTSTLLAGIEALKAGKPVEEAFDLSARKGNLRARKRGPRQISPNRRLYYSFSQREWRARRKLPKQHYLPAEVEQIMGLWRRRDVMPSPEHVARLDAIFRDPVAHCVPAEIRWPHHERVAA